MSDLYLIRRTANPRSVKYSNVIEVTLSGLRTAYASVTGANATGIVTITGSTMTDGMQVILTSLSGGSGVSTGVSYFAVNSTGATCKLATIEGGAAISLGSDITSASAIVVNPQMRVWSSEFRDIFTPIGVNLIDGGGATTGSIPSMTGVIVDDPSYSATSDSTAGITGTPIAANSDEISHAPLRQTLVNRTFWIFDRGSSVAPRYLYAEYQTGDVIADNAPTQ